MNFKFSLTTILAACALIASAQSVTYPYNPDGNADQFISITDLQDLLMAYGQSWTPQELAVDSIPLSLYLQTLQAFMEANALPPGTQAGQFLKWDGEAWVLVVPKVGCTDPEACTYDAEATTLLESMCLYTDACGECDGPGAIQECGCTAIPEGDCDCDGNQLDALNVCGGTCLVDEDGDGICDDDGVDECVGSYDTCGICNGPGAVYDCGCSGIPSATAIAAGRWMPTATASATTSTIAWARPVPWAPATAPAKPTMTATAFATTTVATPATETLTRAAHATDRDPSTRADASTCRRRVRLRGQRPRRGGQLPGLLVGQRRRWRVRRRVWAVPRPNHHHLPRRGIRPGGNWRSLLVQREPQHHTVPRRDRIERRAGHGGMERAERGRAYCTTGGQRVRQLYNGYAAARDLCPQFWDVPTQVEWQALSDAFGGNAASGGALKESGLGHWQSPNAGATNESGFTALPGESAP